MRTYKVTNPQNTVVVEIETDAVTGNPNKTTIHDIKFKAGDPEKIVAAGFYPRVPDVVDGNDMVKIHLNTNLSITIINPDNGVITPVLVANDFEIVTESLMDGNVGDEYSFLIQADSGTSPYTFEVEGDLPAGISLSEGGVFSGTPTEDGVFTFNIIAKDFLGQVVAEEFTLTVTNT